MRLAGRVCIKGLSIGAGASGTWHDRAVCRACSKSLQYGKDIGVFGVHWACFMVWASYRPSAWAS